jgi:hypothetical protein
MSINLIVTDGFGNGTLTGSIKDIVTMGYDIGIQIIAVGHLVGETLVFNAYNTSSSIVNALNGDINISNALDTESRIL